MKYTLKIIDKNRMDYARQRKDNYNFDPNVPKKFLRNYKGYKVYIVDGNYVRKHIDIDYLGGGNPSRYQYIPEDEFWIEKLSDGAPEDILGFIVHEYEECEMMKKQGMDYETAHDKASTAERKIRNRYK